MLERSVARLALGAALAGVLAGIVVGVLRVRPAAAVPAFARQYDLQCNVAR